MLLGSSPAGSARVTSHHQVHSTHPVDFTNTALADWTNPTTYWKGDERNLGINSPQLTTAGWARFAAAVTSSKKAPAAVTPPAHVVVVTAVRPAAVRPAAPTPAPTSGAVSDGTSTDTPDWACIRDHESGDNYSEPGGGAYQFESVTWADYDGYAEANEAPPAVQDQKALLTYRERGWEPWSTRYVCGL
jgi:hypothetical protein